MTIETSHGKARLTTPRLSDMGTESPKGRQAKRGAPQGNSNGKYAHSKRASKGPLEAVVAAQVGEALKGQAMPEESRVVAENALRLASDAGREVGVVSPYVVHHTTRFGVNAALAGFYTQAAAQVGFGSDRGMALVEMAHRCEKHATQAMVASAAAVKEFAGKRPKALDLTAVLAQASKPREAK